MAKDLEKLIDTVDIPEMEYTSQGKRKSVSYEVPEVVLPKTKAEMYEEAKGRLTQKTTAASCTRERTKRKTYKPDKPDTGKKPAKVKTVELESAAAAAIGAASNATLTREKKKAEEIKKQAERLSTVSEPKWVGKADELVPFSWAHPLVDVEKPSKYYKTSVRTAKPDATAPSSAVRD